MLAANGAYSVWIHGADHRERRSTWQIPQRRLTYYLLVCSKEGEEQLNVDGREYRVGVDDCYLIPPKVLADIGSAAGNRPVWCHFDVRGTEARVRPPLVCPFDSTLTGREEFLQPGPRETWGVDLPVLVPPKLRSSFATGIQHIVKLWLHGDQLSMVEANHVLSGLMLKWAAVQWRDKKAVPKLSMLERIERAEAQACQSLDSGFGVVEFATAAGMSRSHFCEVYEQVRGSSPGEFLRRERIRQAELLLRRSELSISAIGEMVGYPDPTVFVRSFRLARKVTPGEWRRRARPVKSQVP